MKKPWFALLSLLISASLYGQTITIRAVDAKHLKPVVADCLNISLGGWHGADLFAHLTPEGTIQLEVDQQAHTARVSSKSVPCNQMQNLGPASFRDGKMSIAVLADWLVACQTPVSFQDANGLKRSTLPDISIDEIMQRGAFVRNTCTRQQIEPKPGELVVVLRNRTLKEKLAL